jgi:hypothetical protein
MKATLVRTVLEGRKPRPSWLSIGTAAIAANVLVTAWARNEGGDYL